MDSKSDFILEQALQLPLNERAEVAEQLIRSLDTPPDIEVEKAWQQEIQQRLSELDNETTTTIPWEEVKRRLTHGS